MASTLRLVAQRAVAQRVVLGVVAALVALTTAAIGASAVLLDAAEQRAPAAALAVLTPQERHLALAVELQEGTSTSIAYPAPPAVDAATRVLRSLVAPAPLTTQTWAESALLTTSSAHQTVQDAPGTYLAALPDDAPLALVSGALPAAGAGADADGTIPVAVPARAARDLGWTVGKTVRVASLGPAGTATVKVTGIYTAKDPSRSWTFDHLGGAAYSETEAGQIVYGEPLKVWGPLLTSQDALAASPFGVGRLEVVGTPDLSRLTAAQARAVGARMPQAQERAATALASQVVTVEQVDNPLVARFAALVARIAVTRTVVLVAALVLLLVGGAAALLAARMVAEQRGGEVALMIARGGSRRQVLALAAVEALGLAVVVAAVAPAVAAVLVRLVGAALGGETAVPGIAGALSGPVAWWVCGASALALSSLLLMPYLRRGADRHRPPRVRPGAARAGRLLARSGGVVVPLAVAGIAVWQLAVRPLQPNGAADPVLVAAPALLLLAGGLLVVHLLPLLARAGDRAAARARGFVVPMAFWESGRRPARAAQSVVLVTLAVAAAVFAVSALGTWRTSQVEQASFAVGAPLRVTPASSDPLQASADVAAFAGAHGAALHPVTVASVTAASTGTDPVDARLLAADDGAVLRGRLDAVAGPGGASGWADVLRDLRRPDLTRAAGPALPDGTVRVALTMDFGLSGAAVAQYGSVLPEVVLEDAHGVRSVRVLRPDGATQQYAATARDDGGAVTGTRVVALQLVTDPMYAMGSVAARVAFSDLTALDTSGRRTPVGLGSAWSARSPQYVVDSSTLVPQLTQDDLPATVTDGAVVVSRPVSPDVLATSGAGVVVAPSADGRFPGLAPVAGTKAYAVPPVPAVVTPGMADSLGVGVGGRFTLAGPAADGDVDAYVSGVVRDLPGGASVLVRRDVLEAVSAPDDVAPMAADEWWGTAAPGSDAATTTDRPGDVQTLAAAIIDLRDGPDRIGIQAALLLLAGCALLLAVAGAATSVAGSLQLRRLELARLQAVGASRSALVRSAVAEHALLLGVGLVGGCVVGFGAAALLAVRFAVGPDGGTPVPAPWLVVPWPALAGCLLALVAGAALAVGTTSRTMVQRARAALLRLGADS
ncbi:MAG: hypothetical protein FWF90_02350 [Promicromonosporaceae bacterium]|nr:hypothetical protein [Promicromonosporaceae bacterium]